MTTTIDSRKRALTMAKAIVKEGLAACVHQWPIHSIYSWKGKLESTREYLLSCKTPSLRAPALQKFIRKHHPYELPEIIVTPIEGGLSDYLAWLSKGTQRHH